jgi:hypothetical protein
MFLEIVRFSITEGNVWGTSWASQSPILLFAGTKKAEPSLTLPLPSSNDTLI